MTRRQKPQVGLLPDDVLADEVLRRAGPASPRSLAVCRCVCRAWRAIIDDRRLLRADLLPRSLAGIVADYTSELPYAEFFARPSVDDPWDDYRMPRGGVADHCNGLLLVDYDCVYNPATGAYATLPEPPAASSRRTAGGTEEEEDLFIDEAYLVFDPAVSPSRYEVLLIPRVPTHPKAAVRLGSAMLCSEWPPSPCVLRVFSSTKGLWEERSFARQGEAAGTVADMLLVRDWLFQLHAEYWRGALYVQCQTHFVMRISLSTSTYRVIKPPSIGTDDQEFPPHPKFFLGRSEQGIYYALLDLKDHRLRVWILDESCDDRIGWRLRHDTGRGLVFPSPRSGDGPWILNNANYDDSDESGSEDESSGQDDDEETQVGEQEFEWNSDDDGNALPTDDDRVEQERGYVLTEILAFHPYREIVFLHRSNKRALVYHLRTSKLEDLGNFLPKQFCNFGPAEQYAHMRTSFPYTPCRMGELPKNFRGT